MRRTLIILVILLNAVAPTFAGTCASQCATAGTSSHLADPSPSDCHDSATPGDADRGVPVNGDEALMQAACAIAGAVALTPAIVVVVHDAPTDSATAASAAFVSRVAAPPDHPPRASSI